MTAEINQGWTPPRRRIRSKSREERPISSSLDKQVGISQILPLRPTLDNQPLGTTGQDQEDYR